jgi:predicted nuclease of predicted toxin-antitoxin system
MRFLVDECAGPAVARWLEGQGHEVFSVFDSDRGANDVAILDRAVAENWIVITADKDFGELVYREQLPHCGVVLLRLTDGRAAAKLSALGKLLKVHSERLINSFTVVTEATVRINS